LKTKIFFTISFLFAFFIFFIFGEVLTRIFFQGIIQYPEHGKTQDPYKPNPYSIRFRQGFHSHYPNVEYIQSRADYSVKYKINSNGFRETEFSVKPKGKRLVFIGDSVVEGHGVEYEETFVSFLKAKLADKYIEVLNLGTQGASFVFHAVNLERYLQFKPDYIVFCITENDWTDDRVLELAKDKLPVLENPYLLERSNFSFLFHSKLVQFIYFRYYSYHRSKTKVEKLILSNMKQFEKIIDNKSELDLFSEHRALGASKASGNFDISKKYIQFLIDECQKKNIKVFFVNLTYMAYSSSRAGNTEFIKISNKLLKTYLEEKKIPYRELEDVVLNFYKMNPKEEFFIINDDHPTKKAHVLFGERISAWLLEFDL
jgi:lysophospholipase L1-like esterase